MKLAAVILAAGQGTRMKTRLPKVLHPVVGKPMVWYALETVAALGCDQTVLVVGHGADQVRDTISNLQSPISNFQPSISTLQFAEQREQRGTGHAVLQARDALRGKSDAVFIVYGDMPLLRAETLKKLTDLHASSRATITLLTLVADDSMAFGRIVRDANKRVLGIVEERDATPEQLAIRELNCGVYCFDAAWLWDRLAHLQPTGAQNEYYLTDLVALAVRENRAIETMVSRDAEEMLGINTRVQLVQAEKIMRARINDALMLSGVTLIDPATTYIEPDVTIGEDTIIEPNTHLRGKTRIGANCRIGPNAIIRDAQIGDECAIVASDVTESIIEARVQIGPFARLRAGTHLARAVRIGNFGEVKNSRVGEKSHIGHFSYVGDADLGARVNIGAGTITCNYDGKRKNRTLIGDDVFIGSDTLLIAPVTIGARARTGAGAVVNKDVPADSLAVGVPARVIRKLNDK
ncbi:MAG: UDP-N-acetylglucosamine diphosphorylase/glucosamine-1-phosphate N-acetyltransferase [Chloroflexi bacterium]|nr:UDP-N-acetylglucosamine diphosphorylase/glucosamine-1-phosphate N-acetyltransferase [Chloroflexota bacterium]